MTVAGIICTDCGGGAPRTGPNQRYCAPCSVKRSAARAQVAEESHVRRDIFTKPISEEMSTQAASSITETMQAIQLEWLIKISVPFDWAASKNHIHALDKRGHLFLRKESQTYRDIIGYRVKQALGTRKLAHNKVWLDFFVQKPNNRGDAINVIDSLCDAIKGVIGVDDRWFAIRRLDWEIVKKDPQIFIGIGQTSLEDVQACSYCGRILSLDNFRKRKDKPMGVDRVCKICKGLEDNRIIKVRT